jgi:CBS domain-containing protein
VRDLITREVRTLDPNDRLSVADELMRLGRFRHAVVLDDQHELAGVLSQRDIFFNALSWSLGQGASAHQKALEAVVVKEVMRADVTTIGPEASLAEAASRLREHQIGCLPVMDGDALVGILTEGDFLALLSQP